MATDTLDSSVEHVYEIRGLAMATALDADSRAFTRAPSVEPTAASLFDRCDVDSLSDGQIAERLVGFATQIAYLTAHFLELLAEFDDRGGWGGEGIMSCAHWLSLRTGMSKRTAHDHLRVAHALQKLPEIRAAFAQGRLSYSKVRAVTRVATPQRESELLSVALSADANQLERVVRSIRTIDQQIDAKSSEEAANNGDAAAEPLPIESTASFRWNPDGSLSVTMRLAPVDGAIFLAGTIRAEYERTRVVGDPDLILPDQETGTGTAQSTEPASDDRAPNDPALWKNTPANIAPAVVAMAETMQSAITIPTFTPGAELVVHTYQEQPVDPHLDNGPALSDSDVDEATCCGSHRTVEHRPAAHPAGARRPAGRPTPVTGWGRKTRVPNTRILRTLMARDGGCRFPGCGRTRHLHAHHVRFWSRGGATTTDNMILLCSAHHRGLHRGEFSISAHALEHFTFHRGSDGAVIEESPSLHAPDGWQPADVAANTVLPVNPGTLDLGYATEVLYAAWAFTQRRAHHELAA